MDLGALEVYGGRLKVIYALAEMVIILGDLHIQ